MIIFIGLVCLFGIGCIYRGVRHSWRERGKAQWLKVPGKFGQLRGGMAHRYTGTEKGLNNWRWMMVNS